MPTSVLKSLAVTCIQRLACCGKVFRCLAAVNVVAPPWVTETLKAYGMPLEGGLSAATVAKAYVQVVEGKATGQRVTP